MASPSDPPASSNAVGQDEEAPPKASIWWEEVTGAKHNLSMEYLLDLSTPWSAKAFEHVLVPSYCTGTAAENRAAVLSLEDRIEALEAIGKTCKAICPSASLKQPAVYFVGREVHIAALTRTLLEGFWKSPPIFRGQLMKFVSRGLPYNNVTTCYLSLTPPLKLSKLKEEIDNASVSMQVRSFSPSSMQDLADSDSTPSGADSSGRGGIRSSRRLKRVRPLVWRSCTRKMVIASLYHINGLPGGFMFGGELYLFLSGEQDYVYATFIGENAYRIKHD